MSEEERDFSQARRGPVVAPAPNKTRITIRIDTDVLNWFRDRVHQAGGGNYQTLVNEALRQYIQSQDESLETALMLERKAFQLLFDSADQREGMNSFLEKRKPKFQGR